MQNYGQAFVESAFQPTLKPYYGVQTVLLGNVQSTICPCCKQPTSVKIPIVDLNTNTVSWRGKSTKLAHTKIDLLSLLVRRFPSMVSHDQIIIHLWGDDEGEDASNTVKVHVCQMRKQIAHMGIGIQNIWGSGYKLELAQ